MQVADAPLQVFSIFSPRHPIHTRCRLSLQAVVTFPEQVDAYVVQQSRELLLPSFFAASRTRSSPFGPLSRLGVRCD